MAPKSVFRCTECGYEAAKFFGRCPDCNAAGSAEEAAVTAPASMRQALQQEAQPAAFASLADAQATHDARVATGVPGLDEVLGGGMVKGSYIVLSAEPGAGKSTMATQLLGALSAQGMKVGLVCGEESPAQVRMRFQRLSIDPTPVLVTQDVECERIVAAAEANGLDLIVVDSIQTVVSQASQSAPGSPQQVREAGQVLMRLAKQSGCAVLLIGQVTKEGSLAGPRMLEHLVDVVLSIEGDRDQQLRILRAVKNRFGTTDELGLYEMTGAGLQLVPDPSALLVTHRPEPAVGSVVCPIVEGSRPMLVEIQALVQPSNLPQPIRACRGLDARRFQMLLAVLTRRIGIRLGSCDVYLQLAGGVRSDDPALDLACCLAVASAATGRPPRQEIAAFGEVTLLSEIRRASMAERRAQEATRLGIPLVVSHHNATELAQAITVALADTATAPLSHPDSEEAMSLA